MNDSQIPANPDACPDPGDLISVDVYGIKLEVPISRDELLPSDTTKPYPVRAWQDVWQDCLGRVQHLVVSLSDFLSAFPETATKLVQNVGRISDSLADLTTRIAHGRSRSVQRENKANLGSESNAVVVSTTTASELPVAQQPNPASESESTDSDLRIIEEVFAKVRLRGGVSTVVRTAQGQLIVLLVPEAALRESLYQAFLSFSTCHNGGCSITSLKLPCSIVESLTKAGVTTVEELQKLTISDVRTISTLDEGDVRLLEPYVKK